MIERVLGASIFLSIGKSISSAPKFGMLFFGITLGIVIGDTMHDYYGCSNGAAFHRWFPFLAASA